jgi:sugar lactone lactonase YvrE
VWRLDALGRSQCLLIDRFAKPNGIAFSRDQRYVYIYDSDYIGCNGKRNSL